MTYTLRELTDAKEKRLVSRAILEALPDWFGVAEAREHYIEGSGTQTCFAAFSEGAPIGFLCLKPTGRHTVELAVMGVLQSWHRRGVGAALFERAKARAREQGYKFMQVKTVRLGMYPDYDATNRFYLSLGFQEFEVIPQLWGEENPCQIYVMGL